MILLYSQQLKMQVAIVSTYSKPAAIARDDLFFSFHFSVSEEEEKQDEKRNYQGKSQVHYC